MKTSRRRFLSSAASVSAGFFGLRQWTSHGLAQGFSGMLPRLRREEEQYQNELSRYGPLISDPNRIFDLPDGFHYTVISRVGDLMSDGFRVPGAPDGMAAFEGENGRVILIRNHELAPEMTFDGPFGVDNSLFGKADRARIFDAGEGTRPHQGGTTTLVYDPATQTVERQFMSLAGTCRNCAGGPTPWKSWISCEETVEVSWESEKKAKKQRGREVEEEASAEPAKPEKRENFNEKDHGYNFEVPADSAGSLVTPAPLTAMGRFNHEAIAVDPHSGIVYQTEDRDDGLIYRFIPHEPGKLASGGKLQALAIRGRSACDTRNWPETGKAKLPINAGFDVEWIDLDKVESPRDDLRTRGYKKGAACFARGEGMWYGRSEIFFACTNGGISKTGQIFRYRPSEFEGTEREQESPGRLVLYLEPNNTHLIQSCDNLTVAEWGDLFICEDGLEHNYLRGVTTDGKIYTLGDSAYFLRSELCGVCFAPNHPTLFVNLQRPGLTLAITGPWVMG
ncbi:MAG TPA: DUF839 domain-containing protein [Verrucomicrobiota bacterium]|nr:phosphatase [Verrucomicrobiales bacterium]HRI14399.1 DUF839 domain-containing protein [Verrucomicrobiota bacterium]